MADDEVSLVSVFMPSYNHVDFIEEALRSVLEQDYPRFEIIIPDDCSTDGTVEELRRLAAEYPGVVVPVFSDVNLGPSRNFNRGLTRCQGEFIAFTAGDDLMLPGKLRAQVEWFQRSPSRVLCGHDIEVFLSESGEPLFRYSSRFPLRSGFGPRHLIRQGILFGGCSIMARREAIPPDGYDETLTVFSDWRFFVEVLHGGGEYGYLPETLARYRRHVGSITNSTTGDTTAILRTYEEGIRAAASLAADHPEHRRDGRVRQGRLAISSAQLLLLHGGVLEARRLLRTGARLLPSRLPWVVSLLAVTYLPRPWLDQLRRAVTRVRRTTRAS